MRIVHEEPGYRMYEDGSEEVSFTDEEWAEMLSDPKYGYVCNSGRHRLTDADRREGGCMACHFEAEDAYYAELAEMEGQ